MSLFEAIILGLVQGLTEFIPISSSGHLVLVQALFGRGQDHLFLEWINVGTVLALIVFFRHRIVAIIDGIIRKRDYRLARNIVVSAIPAGVIGFTFADIIESEPFFGSVTTVLITLFVVGVLMVVLDKLPRLSAVSEGAKLSVPRALAIGLAQAAALVPGVSRSGSTIIAGRLLGLKPAAAAEYSFLLSIPIMLGVLAKVSIKPSDRAYLMDNLSTIIVGNTVAFISGLLAVGFLMRYLERHNLSLFGWYRIGLVLVVGTILLVASF